MSDYTLNGKTVDYYGPEMTARREKFNRIINGMDMILMNNIAEVDESVWDNWQGKEPTAGEDCEWFVNKATVPSWCCNTHMFDGTGDYPAKDEAGDDNEHPDICDFADQGYAEVYQWFAVGDSDADYLKRHNQYITYSDMLDTYFLAICHLGTSWDYVDSMVNDILGDD
jgi:hypothetical protein